MHKLRIGLLVSGRGSVLRTLLRVCGDGSLPGEVIAVASNRECPALDLAREGGIGHVAAYPVGDYASRAERDARMAADLMAAGVNFVVVGGYSEALEPGFFTGIPQDTISMYPALLPAFGELDEAIGPALDAGVKVIGVTIHFRTPLSLSAGPIIAQEPLPVDLDDTVESVTARVIALESEFLPRVLRAFSEGRVVREGEQVRVLEQAAG
jgi:phosphoribosylglycinamide formyltransferase-1